MISGRAETIAPTSASFVTFRSHTKAGPRTSGKGGMGSDSNFRYLPLEARLELRIREGITRIEE
jgi:hypothetical protein